MTIKQLEYFMETARQLSFSKAAENLFISQSALSRSIAALEDELGTILLFRNRHSVALTPSGILLASHIPRLHAELARTVDLVRQAHEGMRGQVTIGVETGLALPDVIDEAIRYFHVSMPFINVLPRCIECGDLFQELADGRVDFIITYVPEGSELSTEHLSIPFEKQRVFLASSSAQRWLGEKVTLKELADAEFILGGGADTLPARRWKQLCAGNGFSPKLSHVDSSATCEIMIGLGAGVGFFPGEHRIFASSPSIKKTSVEPAFFVNPTLIWNRSNLNPSVEVFEKVVRGDI